MSAEYVPTIPDERRPEPAIRRCHALDPKVYLRHRHARRVYGLELAEGARAALRLNEGAARERPTFTEFAAAWRDRWLLNRILNPEVRERVSKQGPNTVREELTAPSDARMSLLARAKELSTERGSVVKWSSYMAHAEKSNPALIQSLYRALGACADHHSDETAGAAKDGHHS